MHAVGCRATRICSRSTRLISVLASLQAPKPSAGPHKSRECLPLIIILRNRLKCVPDHRIYTQRTHVCSQHGAMSARD